MTLNLPLLYVLWLEEYCQTSPNKNKSPNLWHVTSILVCCIFGPKSQLIKWYIPIQIFFCAFHFYAGFNGEILYEQTSSIASASAENLTKEQMSLLNCMMSKLNENIRHMVGERTLEKWKSNETAVNTGKIRVNFPVHSGLW